MDRKGPPPKPLVSCRGERTSASRRPLGRGPLEEVPADRAGQSPGRRSRLAGAVCWPTTSSISIWRSSAARPQRPATKTTNERRPRDTDLSQHDRVDIFLDCHRDYATYYHLTIDHRGWAADAYCGDRSWNPKWFVAAQTIGRHVDRGGGNPLGRAKATIVPGKTVWALGVQRTVPGMGFQSWTTPAATAVMPEGFGWLGFECM